MFCILMMPGQTMGFVYIGTLAEQPLPSDKSHTNTKSGHVTISYFFSEDIFLKRRSDPEIS
jgi:hypothetical protein